MCNGTCQDYANYSRTHTEACALLIWTCTSFVLGILGNLFIMFAVYRQGIKIDTNSLLFIKNLAVSDLLFNIIWVLPTLITLLHHNTWVLGDTMCHVTAYLQYTPAIATICFITMLSLNKFMRCMYPLRHVCTTSRTILILSVASWIFGFIHPSMYFFSSLARTDKRQIMLYLAKSSCDYYHGANLSYFWKTLDMLSAVVYTFIPTLLLITANIGLIKIVKDKGPHFNKSNLALVFILTVVFIGSYSPYVVEYTVPMLGLSTNIIPNWFKTLKNFALFANSWFNVFVYYSTNATFRHFTRCTLCFKPFSPSHLDQVYLSVTETVGNTINKQNTRNNSVNSFTAGVRIDQRCRTSIEMKVIKT